MSHVLVVGRLVAVASVERAEVAPQQGEEESEACSGLRPRLHRRRIRRGSEFF